MEVLRAGPHKTTASTTAAAWTGVTKKSEGKGKYFLPTGFTFPCRLNTAIFSYNIKTPAIATVERDIVYLGRVVIPQKTRVIGSVGIQKSNDRVLIQFHTLVFPQGDETPIPGMAISLDGSAGIKGKVDKQKDSAVANTVLRSVLAGGQTALEMGSANPVVSQTTSGITQEALRDLALERQQVTSSISVAAETSVRVYIVRRTYY